MTKTEAEMISSDLALVAVLALLADEREARVASDKSAKRTEVLLADAGLSYSQIASLLHRSYESVKSAIRRSRDNGKKGSRGSE